MFDRVLTFPSDHPALAGHFPGNPLLPGAVLLDHAAAAIAEELGGRVAAVRSAKFLRPLRAGEACHLQAVPRLDGTLGLTCTSDGTTVMTAILETTPGSSAP